MIKLNFGCGGNRLEGWDNFDAEVDISKWLPFQDSVADFILAEHVVEHVTHKDAWNFFSECHRILKVGGVLRVAVPDVERIWFNWTPAYGEAVKAGGHGDGTLPSSVRAAVFEHGHQAVWNQSLLMVFLNCAGFKCTPQRPGKSVFPELQNIDGHGKVVGESIAAIETSTVDAVKI